MLAGFIVGFDSDDETIFDRQLEFINRTAIAWAMAGVLQAPPTTALYDRMKREGRLYEDSQATSNFSPPNFRTMLPLPVLLRGLSKLLTGLYEPEAFFRRAFRSLELWRPQATQFPPELPWTYNLRVMAASIWRQGLRSKYKVAYWRFLRQMLVKWSRQPAKLWLGFMVLLSAEHFLIYSHEVVADLERECRKLEMTDLLEPGDRRAADDFAIGCRHLRRRRSC